MRYSRTPLVTRGSAAIASLVIACLIGVARGQVDDAVRSAAAGLTVQTGNTTHNVADELPKLDALRVRTLEAISVKTNAQPPNYDLADELKALERLDNYSAKLGELIAATRPNAKDVASWLQANAAVMGAWREAYTSTAPFADNTRMAELKAIETRMGRRFAGGMGNDIRGLHAIDDSAVARAGQEEIGRRVRLASGLVEKDRGMVRLTFKVQPAVVTAGQKVTTVVGIALGGGGPDGMAGDSPTEQILFEVAITGPKDFSLGNLHKKYAPGASVDTSGYFTIPTDGLPEGNYTAALSATDQFGKSWTRVDIFDVKNPPASQPGGGMAAGAKQIGAALQAGFKTFVSNAALTNPTITGSSQTYVSFGGNRGDNERGTIGIQGMAGMETYWANTQKSDLYRKITINGKDARVHTGPNGDSRPSPSVTVIWASDGLYCNVQMTMMNEQFSDATAAAAEKRALDLAKNLDDVIVNTAGK